MRAAKELIKSERWWDDKTTPVLAFAYLMLALSEPLAPVEQTLPALLAFMAAFIGVAGYGHVINDLCDIEADRIAGKHNPMDGRSKGQIALIMLVLVLASGLPWLWLPRNMWNMTWLGLQIVLLTLYAVPPARLKVRFIGGPLADALYAYTVPALITCGTWSELSGPGEFRPWLLAAIVPWSLCAGLRGILYHQYLDVENDRKSGIETFASRYGGEETLAFINRWVLPTEVMSFAALTAAIASEMPLYTPGMALFIVWRMFQLKYLWRVPMAPPWQLPPEGRITLYGYQFLGEFYTGWFPVFILVDLVFRDPAYLVLFAMHLTLFKTGVVQLLRHELKYVPKAIARMKQDYGF